MAKLVAVCRDETDFAFERRQIPLNIEDTLTMVMEIPETVISTREVNEYKLQSFHKRFQCLSADDLAVATTVRQKDVLSFLSHSVPCVGCRRSTERLYNQLVESGQPALEPLIITSSGVLTIDRPFLNDPKLVYALFYIHGSRLSEMVDSIPKGRRNRRCPLHSLETHKSRPSGSWIDVWDLLSQECRDEVVLIDSDALLDTLENYLRKHRFCTECKSKVLRAYSILAGDLDGPSEKGYCAALYDGLKSCPQERHVHVLCDTDYIAHLIGRAEPELAGGRRERHAKTLDIAQEEVLTCLGIHLWERLHRLWQKLRAEEQTWQMLFYLGVEALRKSFEVAVEEKQGISRLEQVVEEISEAERAKELRREQKRLKKKAKRKEKCKCHAQLTISTANNELKTEETAKNEEELEEEVVCVNENVEETEEMNGHGDSCEDDEDDGDSGGSPCSCEDLSNCERRKNKKSGYRNGDCGYVAEYTKWSRMVHQSGDTCNHVNDSSTIGIEEENTCTDCLNGSPVRGGSPQGSNGKGRKKKGKNKEKKQNSPRHEKQEKLVENIDDEEKRLLKLMGWKDGGTESMECFSSEEDLCISEQEILRFKANQSSVSQQRRKLREKLRQQFNKMTLKEGLNVAIVH
ncbi:gametogenetin-binding protein 2-like [Stylophora pistillata]|uniref:Gametogenetin-binding protein 2 n=1 Tax=Stylophora pistillata TaxID=50429 RepID=A0A2B4S4C1_STYPI|nr:gametogenetin-binding protein 2-like [Stylophora pistillata]PFX23903.1 Gametogenetin-binding protein 2 [Stylophora pistillata]